MIIFGLYTFSPRVIAFRRDYCRRCSSPSISYAQRTFDAGHLFWIPLLPLGFRTRWFCRTCNHKPHEPPTSPRRTRLLVAAFVFLISSILWLSALNTEVITPGELPNDTYLLPVAVLSSVAFILSIWWLWNASDDKFSGVLGSIKPYDAASCPLCSGKLATSFEGLTCEQCDAEHRPLKSSDNGLLPD